MFIASLLKKLCKCLGTWLRHALKVTNGIHVILFGVSWNVIMIKRYPCLSLFVCMGVSVHQLLISILGSTNSLKQHYTYRHEGPYHPTFFPKRISSFYFLCNVTYAYKREYNMSGKKKIILSLKQADRLNVRSSFVIDFLKRFH